MLNFIWWLIVGLIAGFLASKIVNNAGQGPLTDILLGLGGAFVGGFLFSLLGFRGKGPIYSIVVATAGAILVLFVYHRMR